MTRRAAAQGAMGPALLLLVVAWFLYEGRHPQPQVDDAFISYRYARNLADGYGLIYNLGERVEGFSNLLWTLLVATGIALGGEAARVGYFLGLASGTASLIVTYLYAATAADPQRRWIAAVAPALLLIWIGFPVWTLSGLETPLFAAAVGAALAAEARGRIGMAMGATMIASLTRPEGPLLATVILAANFAGWGNVVEVEGAVRRRRVVAWGLAYAAGMAGLTAIRLYYYGAVVPNTFYAKVDSNAWLAGMADLGNFAFGSALPLFIPATWAAIRDRVGRVGAAWAATMGLYIVWVGGDAFPDHRFWVPVHLVICVLATRALYRATERDRTRDLLFCGLVFASAVWSLVSPRAGVFVLAGLAAAALAGAWGSGVRRAAAVTALVVALVVATFTLAPWLDDAGHSRWTSAIAGITGRPQPSPAASRAGRALHLLLTGGDESRRQRLGVALWARADHLRRAAALASEIHRRRERGEEIDLVAATAIGKFGYDVRIAVLDMLGLTDAHIARSPARETAKPVWRLAGHARTDADYVFGRQPDYIFLPRRSSTMLRLPLYDDVWSHPALDRDYEWDDAVEAYRSKSLGPLP